MIEEMRQRVAVLRAEIEDLLGQANQRAGAASELEGWILRLERDMMAAQETPSEGEAAKP